MRRKPAAKQSDVVNTIRQKKSNVLKHTQDLSETMQIAIEAVFESLPVQKNSHLDITCPGIKPLRVTLDGKTFLIGRDESCPICLPLTSVSREHAQISFNGEEYLVNDLNSTNGTFVNNIKINRCILRNNDLIRIGDAKLLFIREKIAG